MGVTERLLAQIAELRVENARLEEEADWLAERMAQVCHECGSMCYRGDLPICPLKGSCQKETADGWRKAARKAVEKDNG